MVDSWLSCISFSIFFFLFSMRKAVSFWSSWKKLPHGLCDSAYVCLLGYTTCLFVPRAVRQLNNQISFSFQSSAFHVKAYSRIVCNTGLANVCDLFWLSVRIYLLKYRIVDTLYDCLVCLSMSEKRPERQNNETEDVIIII